MKPGVLLAGRFQIEQRAGAGGMGEVFRALDQRTGEAVAVKVLRDARATADARFAREAEVLEELKSPGIVRYVARGTGASGEPFLVMEWLEGEDLGQRLRRGPLAISEAVRLGIGVGAALAVAHARGVVHRDLKPSNLFLVEGDEARVKILDFGIAWQGGLPRMTRTGAVIGTPGYLAPELARGRGAVDARADVFALGCVLFECIAGKPAFAASVLVAVLAKVLFEDAPRLAELVPGAPAELDALVAQMLDKQPERRPRDGAAVAAALEELRPVVTSVHAVRAVHKSAPIPRAAALTSSERRIVSVAVIERAPAPDADAPTPAWTEVHAEDEALRRAAEEHGAMLEPLADGSSIVTLAGTARVATDQAALAARCALALRAIAKDRSIALATGRAQMTGQLPMGDAIDRAARLLGSLGAEQGGAPRLLVDEITAGLLDARFEVAEGPAGLEIRGEHALADGARTLLGRATACVGRDWEIGTLEGFYRECIEEPIARAVLVTAAAGAGKSRLAHEFVRRQKSRGDDVSIWIGRTDSLRAGSAFGLLGQVLRSALGVREGDPIEARRQAITSRVAEHVAAPLRQRVAEFLGEIVGTPFPAEESAKLLSARQDPQLMGEQMQRAWVDFVRAESAARPLIVVLEDLHWGDLPTVRFVDAALRAARDVPWLVMALARPEVHERFPKLWAERGLQEIRLKALSPKASERLARQVLGDSVGTGTIERIVAQADGHAFYLEELIRAVAEKKGAELPETVLAMVEARLAGLSAEARRVLRAASVFGEVCWRGGVVELLGEAMRSTETFEWIDWLVEREVLIRREESRFPGEPELAFRHALLREGAYAMLTEDDRALGHRLAGAWLTGRGEADPMVLAEHFDRGGEPQKAGGFYARAAEQAQRGHDTNATIDRAERALRAGIDGETAVDMRMIISDSLLNNGDVAGAFALLEQAIAGARPGSQRWVTAIARKCVASSFLGALGPMMDAVALVQRAEPEPGAAAAFAIALVFITINLLPKNQFALAEEFIGRMEQLGAPLLAQDPRLRGWVEVARAERARFQGDAYAGLAAFTRAEASLAEAGEQRYVPLARHGQSMCLLLLGAHAEARARAESILGSDATSTMFAAARLILTVTKARTGALDEALGEAEAVSALMPPALDFGGIISLLHLKARCQLARGDLDAAEEAAKLAIDVFSGKPADRAHALASLADVRLAQRRPAEALERAEEAAAALRTIPEAYRADAYVSVVHAEALHAAGDHAGVRAAIGAARQALLRRADRIGDPTLRRSFLEDVPENARTLARAEVWDGEESA